MPALVLVLVLELVISEAVIVIDIDDSLGTGWKPVLRLKTRPKPHLLAAPAP